MLFRKDNNEFLVSLSGIKKSYDGKKYILDGIDFTLSRGEMAIIEGLSGSGKSTLLNIIGRLDDSYEGEYISSVREIGFVFQSYCLIESISVRENILLPFLYSTRYIDEAVIKYYAELTKELGIDGLDTKKASLLSGGEKQRVAIARALIRNPEIVIADEPTGNLDDVNTESVTDILRRISKKGCSVIIVTHDIRIANPEDSRYYLKGGKLVRCK